MCDASTSVGASPILSALLLGEEALSISLDQAACDRVRAELRQAIPHAPSEAAALLGHAADALRVGFDQEGGVVLTAEVMSPTFTRRPLEEEIRALRVSLGGALFAYHGTVMGRLDSIVRRGLQPGEVPVWKADDIRNYCASAVFLTDSFGAAQNWAHIAFMRCRGRRESRSRRAVVVRVPAAGLNLVPDRRAFSPGCLMSPLPVPVSDASGSFIGGGPAPGWLPLKAFAALKDLPPLPPVYKLA